VGTFPEKQSLQSIVGQAQKFDSLALIQRSMAVSTLNKKKASKKMIASGKGVKDYSEDPFVLKKAKAAESFLKKHGLPKAFK
jgi:hypothetical protein